MINSYMDLAKNVSKILKDIGTVKLVAVTKSVDVSVVKELKKLGLVCFGENRVNDAEKKIKEVKAEWHLIGHLQTNKVKKAVELFNMIQSVDSIKLAEKINVESSRINKIMPVLLQANIAAEPQKHGFKKEELEAALKKISKFDKIIIKGLMMIAPHAESEKVRPFFREMKNIFNKYQKEYNLEWLSMGMSEDYKIAIEEGANMVRIGRKLYKG